MIDTYIEAQHSKIISHFGNASLLDLIVKAGISEAIDGSLGDVKGNEEAVAETIENNVRKRLMKEHLADPAFYETMSALLDEIIANRRSKALEYEEYLDQIAELAKKIVDRNEVSAPKTINTPALQAFYNNLGQNEALALNIHATVISTRPANWQSNLAAQRIVKGALDRILQNEADVERIFAIVSKQAEYGR